MLFRSARRDPTTGNTGVAPTQLCFTTGPGAPIRVVATTPRGLYGGLSVAPDDSSVLLARYDQASADLMLVDHFR